MQDWTPPAATVRFPALPPAQLALDVGWHALFIVAFILLFGRLDWVLLLILLVLGGRIAWRLWTFIHSWIEVTPSGEVIWSRAHLLDPQPRPRRARRDEIAALEVEETRHGSMGRATWEAHTSLRFGDGRRERLTPPNRRFVRDWNRAHAAALARALGVPVAET